ncbi:unnamed protein product [Strongylus vulgaris]|uniref:Uncharacterized protein n=1 Tax=Strongylus vulgaris TaxID=40348 RepID=A0A3P7KBL2_STRVU|nr:unnamed protein product [Strongylus vulgaris]
MEEITEEMEELPPEMSQAFKIMAMGFEITEGLEVETISIAETILEVQFLDVPKQQPVLDEIPMLLAGKAKNGL